MDYQDLPYHVQASMAEHEVGNRIGFPPSITRAQAQAYLDSLKAQGYVPPPGSQIAELRVMTGDYNISVGYDAQFILTPEEGSK
jgi:hypothetical protein